MRAYVRHLKTEALACCSGMLNTIGHVVMKSSKLSEGTDQTHERTMQTKLMTHRPNHSRGTILKRCVSKILDVRIARPRYSIFVRTLESQPRSQRRKASTLGWPARGSMISAYHNSQPCWVGCPNCIIGMVDQHKVTFDGSNWPPVCAG